MEDRITAISTRPGTGLEPSATARDGGGASLLIVNTLARDDPSVKGVLGTLAPKATAHTVFHTADMAIAPCVGCTTCWLRTPGVCAIKDDYGRILRAFLRHDAMVILCEASLGFFGHRAKNIVDRMLPLMTMYLCVVDGQVRHVPRYEGKRGLGIAYSGVAGAEYLDYWLGRVALNFGGASLGAFSIETCEEMRLCI